MQETWVQSLGLEGRLEEGTAAHSSILTWRIPCTEEPGGCSPWSPRESDTTEVTEHASAVSIWCSVINIKITNELFCILFLVPGLQVGILHPKHTSVSSHGTSGARCPRGAGGSHHGWGVLLTPPRPELPQGPQWGLLVVLRPPKIC